MTAGSWCESGFGQPRDATESRPADLADQVCALYERDGLSTRSIADALGIGKRRVDRLLHAAGVSIASRGAGRARPRARHADPPDLPERLRELYVNEGLTRRQIAQALGISEGLVRLRLAEYGIASRTRGRYSREDRHDVAATAVRTSYHDRGLSAQQAADRLGVSRTVLLRSAHDHAIPVRPGAVTRARTGPIELIRALYADPLIRATLQRHGVAVMTRAGSISERFPHPVALTPKLCIELYTGCGASTTDIELLTGRPSTAVRDQLHRAGITLRPPGGRSPFRRRWEASHTVATQRPAEKTAAPAPFHTPGGSRRGPPPSDPHARSAALITGRSPAGAVSVPAGTTPATPAW